MTGAEALLRALEREGVEVIFGYPGGAILPVYDALTQSPIRHILVRHEQGAALAADGYARATGKVGVCMATSGPGATNLVTGIANAYMDSVPVVAITGQVPTALIGTDAFQEVDIYGITMPIVKHSFLVRRVAELPAIVHEAFRIARSGRRGPVLIDLPKDVASQVAGTCGEATEASENEALRPPPDELKRAAHLLRESQRPLAYVGGGVRWANAVQEFRAFIQTTQIPVVSTLMGLGALPARDELFLGMLGMHGLKAANFAVQSSDLLVAIGVRFDDRATGKLAEFAPHAKVIHLDADAAEVSKLRKADVPLLGDLRTSLRSLSLPLAVDAWRAECLANKAGYAWNYNAPTDGIYAPRFLKELSEAAGDETIFVCDVGQHQMWVAQHCGFSRPEQHLSSGGLGAMGYGLPAAIGAQFGHPQARVINVAGDGSMLMNVQELATVKRYGLPVKILLLDNQSLGMVRQWQEIFFAGRYSAVDLSDNPDFVRLAESFGIPAFCVEKKEEVPGAIQRLLQEPGPLLVHARIDPRANVWPLVPPGRSNSAMLEGAHR
ncbi:MAG: acetolactate synthase 2 catalytic subunit [Acidobacteria bacterium]|nr:acetolactate synthase 2 catalytic subunit [Acidobacteriota bacterium]